MGTLVGFFFLLGFLLYERDQKFVRVFVGRFSHLPNLLYYLRGRPGGPPYPVGGPLGGFQKEPTFPIYNITFMTGQVGRHIQWAVRWGNRKRAGLGSIRAGPYKVQLAPTN